MMGRQFNQDSTKASRLPRARKPRPAVAAVEFAVLLPVLVTFALGMFELARGIQVKQVLNDTARRCCRQAVLPAATNNGVLLEYESAFNNGGLNPNWGVLKIQVGPVSTLPLTQTSAQVNKARSGLDYVQIQVSVPVSKIFWVSEIFLTSKTIESEAVTMLKQ
jgi:hypothetical protein